MNSKVSVGERRIRHAVRTATGAEIKLLDLKEKKFYDEARDKYLSEYKFDAANDMRALDRLLLLETQMFRAQWFLASGMDYDGVDLDAREEIDYRRSVKDLNNQISECQKDLGLTKAQRDSENADSVGGYLVMLKQAAREHGIMRDRQFSKAIDLTHELFALCGAWSRSNDEERRKLGLESAEDIIQWVMEYAKPEFDAIDVEARKTMKLYRRAL